MKSNSCGTLFKGLAALVLLLAAGAAHAQSNTVMPKRVNFEGRLTDSAGNLINGSQNLTIRIYNTSSGGSPIWTETQPGVSLSSGVFAIQLGALTPLTTAVFTSGSTFLEFQVGSETLAPRKPLVATAYAANAGTLQGIDLPNLVTRDTATGNIGIGAPASASQRLYVHGTAATPTMLIQNNGSSDEILRLVTAGNGVSMSLFSNWVYSSGALNLGSGQSTYFRTDLGGSVGIGQTSPANKLDVSGNIKASAFCVPGTDSAQGDCTTAFANCATASYSTPQKAATTAIDDKEVVCPNNWYLINMQMYAGQALPTSGTISLCTAGSGAPQTGTGCNGAGYSGGTSFNITNAVGTILCCQ